MTTPSDQRVFNILEFGAVADASVNNQPMIQAAIEAAHKSGGGIVFIPEGTFGIAAHPDGYGSIHVLSNVMLQGAGRGETVLRLVDGHEGTVTGLVRSPWGEETDDWGISDLTIDGNMANTTGQVDGFFTGPEPGSTLADNNVTVTNVEMTGVSRYGFDPHELTTNLTITDSVAHNNGVDGFVLDRIVGGEISNNESYANGRHGFNVVTTSQHLLFENNSSHDNVGAGYVVQRGSEFIESPSSISFSGGESYGNGREGVLIQFSTDVKIEGMEISDNGMQGVRLYGSSDVTVRDNVISNNSQSRDGGYSEIEIEAYASDPDVAGDPSYEAINNVVRNNVVTVDGETKSAFGIEVIDKPGVDADVSQGRNDISGTRDGAIRLDDGDRVVLNGHAEGGDILGGSASEVIKGSRNSDDVWGGSGDDLIKLRAGDDHAFGEKGNDILRGGSGDDTLDGGTGNDRVNGGRGDDILFGGEGNDRLADGSGDDFVSGGKGNDFIRAGGGNDVYAGNSGRDTLTFKAFKDGVDLNASTKIATSGENVATFSSFEVYRATNFDDTIRGSDNAERFFGHAGNDVIRSAGGADTLTGGAGDDLFDFHRRDILDANGEHRGVDIIRDFSAGDMIDISDVVRTDVAEVSFEATKGGLLLMANVDGASVAIANLRGVTDADDVTFTHATDVLAG
ncbi:MAG: right-handed parallel beta-helix repeat-containing protein [Pseudomonadota bacterium]